LNDWWQSLVDFTQLLANRLPDNFAADAFKSFIGSLVGAGLAFWFALRKDKLIRLQTQKAAGNLAVTTLARLMNDFFQVRAALAKNRADVLAEQPQSPIWMQIKPLTWNYAEHLRFSIEPLTFIFEHKDGPDVFEKLLTVEMKYHDFFHLLREHRRVTEDAQDTLSKAHPDPTKEVPLREYVTALGFARVARMEFLVRNLLPRG